MAHEGKVSLCQSTACTRQTFEHCHRSSPRFEVSKQSIKSLRPCELQTRTRPSTGDLTTTIHASGKPSKPSNRRSYPVENLKKSCDKSFLTFDCFNFSSSLFWVELGSIVPRPHSSWPWSRPVSSMVCWGITAGTTALRAAVHLKTLERSFNIHSGALCQACFLNPPMSTKLYIPVYILRSWN